MFLTMVCGIQVIMSSHKNELEIYVADKFKEVYKYARPTIASGATPAEKGDIKNPWFGVECKEKKTAKAFTIPYSEWIKNCGEADAQYKDPVFIVENEDGSRHHGGGMTHIGVGCSYYFSLARRKQ